MKNLHILYHLQEVPNLQIPNILFPYIRGQIFQELKCPTLKTNNSPTGTVSIHFSTNVTTLRSENANIWLMFINKNMFTLFFVGRNYPHYTRNYSCINGPQIMRSPDLYFIGIYAVYVSGHILHSPAFELHWKIIC